MKFSYIPMQRDIAYPFLYRLIVNPLWVIFYFVVYFVTAFPYGNINPISIVASLVVFTLITLCNLIIVFILAAIIVFIITKRGIKIYSKPLHFNIDNKDISWSQDGISSKVEWNKIDSVKTIPGYIFIGIHSVFRQKIIIPKRVLKPEQQNMLFDFAKKVNLKG